jgi:segregation and condensation protein B
LGPREVRLSQESLEVLALVAYQQPITEAAIAELGKPQAGATLRQLLRRDLIAVERSPDDPKEVRYGTTPRFLSLFGVNKLDDLPRPDELLYK